MVATIIGGLLYFAYKFTPGSYVNAEEYELDYSENEVKNAINKFKQEHPEYVVPIVTINNHDSCELTDGQSKGSTHWYGVYFYYKNNNQIIFTWTRYRGKHKTTFALVFVNSGLNLGNWKDINRDFSRSENCEQKEMFEKEILSKVEEILNSGNNMNP